MKRGKEKESEASIVNELRSDTLRNRVRKVVSSFVGECEQADEQTYVLPPMEKRRREFEIADIIINMIRGEIP